MTVCKYLILFALCSFAGWVFESVFAVVKTGKWERRGFLYGPVCPIYGVGVVSIVLLVEAAVSRLGASFDWWGVFLVAFIGSMVLEYVVHWALEKLFDAYWWDYYDTPLKINGRTCVPAGIVFGAGGWAAVYLISPLWDAVARGIPPFAMELVALVLVVLLTVDTTLTVSALTQFQKQVDSLDRIFNERAGTVAERLVSLGPDVRDKLKEEADRLHEQGVSQAIGAFGAAQRAALMRVKGFRRPRSSSVFQAVKRVWRGDGGRDGDGDGGSGR